MPRPANVALVFLATALLAACGGGGRSLKVTREDGSRIELGGRIRAWCGAYDPASAAPGQPRTLHLVAGTFPPRASSSYFLVSRTLSDLHSGRPAKLDEDADLATLFLLDSRTGNELASNLSGASGSVRFHEPSCRRGAPIRISVNAVLVSENGKGGPVHVKGDLHARLAGK